MNTRRRSRVTLCALVCAGLAGGHAALNAQKPADLRVRIIIAPETLVCGEQGYANYAAPSSQPCRPLDIQEIERWNRTQIVEQTFVIPPSDLRLGDVSPLVDSYSDLVLRAGSLPFGRKAAVFVFGWPQPVSGDVVLSQAAASTIPEKVATGRLRASRRWIYHERADALLPAYGVLWKLSAFRQEWQFWIGG